MLGHGRCCIAMWLNRMLKDRQEILVLGELMLFLAAWGLGVAAAVDDYRDRTNSNAGNEVAANADFLSPNFFEQRGEFE